MDRNLLGTQMTVLTELKKIDHWYSGLLSRLWRGVGGLQQVGELREVLCLGFGP